MRVGQDLRYSFWRCLAHGHQVNFFQGFRDLHNRKSQAQKLMLRPAGERLRLGDRGLMDFSKESKRFIEMFN